MGGARASGRVSALTDGRVAVIHHLAPRGAGSPLHVHHREDEWFYVTEGELTFWVGGQVIAAPAGSFVYGPRDIPHTFEVTSDEARFLLVTEPAGFEGFMRAAAVPAQALTLPPAPSTWRPSQPSTASRSSACPASPPDSTSRRGAPVPPGRSGARDPNQLTQTGAPRAASAAHPSMRDASLKGGPNTAAWEDQQERHARRRTRCTA